MALCISWPTPSIGMPRERRSRTTLHQASQPVGIGCAVVVDEQLGPRRRILTRCLQRDVDVTLAQHVIERPVHQAVGLAGIERLVHHVPCIHLVAEVLHLVLDMLLDVGGHHGLVGRRIGSVARGVRGRLRPRCPHQVVPANAHAIADREAGLGVRVGVVEAALRAFHRTPLHVVARRDAVEVLRQQLRMRAGDVGHIHRRADREIVSQRLEDRRDIRLNRGRRNVGQLEVVDVERHQVIARCGHGLEVERRRARVIRRWPCCSQSR